MFAIFMEQNVIEDIFYLASDEELKKCTLSDGQVPIVSICQACQDRGAGWAFGFGLSTIIDPPI